jgi:hypothetical protein
MLMIGCLLAAVAVCAVAVEATTSALVIGALAFFLISRG